MLQLVLAVTGVVHDSSGAAVPNARVRIQDAATTSGTDGGFRLDGVAPGRHTLAVDHPSFRPFALQIRVGRQSPPPIEVRLSLPILEQKLEVRDGDLDPRADTVSNLDVVAVDRADLDKLPAFQRDFIAALSRFLDPAAVGNSGASVVVDGMEGSRVPVTPSAIEEIRINQNPYTAEFFRPGRSRMEIVTKAGTPDFHGTLNLVMRDYRMDARDAFAATRPTNQWRSFEGSLTGPLPNRKRNSFVVSVSHDSLDSQAVVVARTLAGEVRRNAPTPTRDTSINARVSHEFRPGHTLAFRNEFDKERQLGQGVGGVTLPEAGANFFDLQDHAYAHHRIAVSPRLINEFSTRIGYHNDYTVSASPGVPRIVVLDAFVAGSAQTDQHRTEIDFQFAEVLSWASGKHLLKVGGNSYDINRRGFNNLSNAWGAYSYSSLEDYRLNRPFLFTRQEGDGRVAPVQKDLGAFIQEQYRWRPNLSLGLGFRADWQDTLGDHNNVAPRASFAWAPRKSQRVVVRGGAGLFFERSGTRAVADVHLYNGSRLRQVVIEDPWAAGPARPISLTRFAAGIRNPYSIQSGGGVEARLAEGTVFTAHYTFAKGVSMFRSRDVNAPRSPAVDRPIRTLAQIRQFESSGGQRSHSIELALRGKWTKSLTCTAQYVASVTRNDTSGIYSFPADSFATGPEWSRADFDSRHRISLAGTAKAGHLFDLGVLFSARTGSPYSLTTGRDDNRDSLALDRPAGVRRNTLQGPGNATLDLRLGRELALKPKAKDKQPSVSASLEAFNLLNRTNYVGFVGNLSSPFFGRAVASHPARRLQAGLRFRF